MNEGKLYAKGVVQKALKPMFVKPDVSFRHDDEEGKEQTFFCKLAKLDYEIKLREAVVPARIYA